MKINEIVTEAYTQTADRIGHFVSDIASAVKSGVAKSTDIEKGSKFANSKYNRNNETPGIYANMDAVNAERARAKAAKKAGTKSEPTAPKATSAPSANNAPSRPKTFGTMRIPPGHALKVVMASKGGNVDYFKYPNGKWFVQWTTGSALQLITNPEDIENLNYALPSEKVHAKLIALPTPAKAKGGRK